MKEVTIYLIVRDDPYTLNDVLGMLGRQTEETPEIIAVTPPDLGEAAQHMVDQQATSSIVVTGGDVGKTLMLDINNRSARFVILLDSLFMPSNQVWLDRILAPIKRGDATVVIGRIVHDLYTNYLVINDMNKGQSLTHRDDISPFFFQYLNFAVTIDTLKNFPFPSGGFDTFALRWALKRPGVIRFVADATVVHMDAFDSGDFAMGWKRYAREAYSTPERFILAFTLFLGGLWTDFLFSLAKRAPQWIFYSLYLRIRQATAVLLG